jgi:hypothetical protein
MKLPVPRALAVGALLLLLAAPAGAQSADARFQTLAADYLDGWLARRPHLATRLGVHDWDSHLEPVTGASVAADLEWLEGIRARLDGIPREALPFERAQQYDLLAARVERDRLELAGVRPFENDPGMYVDLVAGSIRSVLGCEFASPCERTLLATRRLRRVPEVLRAAEVNLKRPSRVSTEEAIERFQGALEFYRVGISSLASGCRDPRVQADLAEADSGAVRAVTGFLRRLREDVLPRSTGDFALGSGRYRELLASGEMETAPAESLLARGRAELDRTRARMELLAGRIAPGGGLAAALDSLARDAPAESALAGFVASRLEGVRVFLRRHPPFTPPAGEDLALRQTPPFRRDLSLLSLEAPGPRERRTVRAYLEVTRPGPGWADARKRAHLARLNRRACDFMAIRETFPGRYAQRLVAQRVPSPLRQALASRSGTEGWARYCEQMMVEEGFGDGDPRAELAQLDLALLDLGRLIVGISLHTGGMPLEAARRFFEERCLVAPGEAAREARLVALDPGTIAPTLGKWRILALRDEARAALGDRFDARAFHDALLAQGGAPIPLAREAVLRALAGKARARADTPR